MSQEIGTIKQLLERLLVPRAPTMTRGETAIEEWRGEQQATKTTTRGKIASGHRTNWQQVPCSQAKSTHSVVPNSKRTHTKAGPSRPYKGTISGLPPRSVAPQGSQEKEQTRGAPKPLRNVFDRLGQNAEEDLHVHLDARQHPQRRTTCQHSLQCTTKSMNLEKGSTSWQPKTPTLRHRTPVCPLASNPISTPARWVPHANHGNL